MTRLSQVTKLDRSVSGSGEPRPGPNAPLAERFQTIWGAERSLDRTGCSGDGTTSGPPARPSLAQRTETGQHAETDQRAEMDQPSEMDQGDSSGGETANHTAS